jgi:hypothetical protein
VTAIGNARVEATLVLVTPTCRRAERHVVVLPIRSRRV